MARSAIPDFGKEWPEYEYKPFPKFVGLNELGEAIIAKDEKELAALKGTEFFPRVMGRDKDGKDVIARRPRDLEWLKGQVVTPPEDPAVVAKREADAKAAEEEIKRKAAAYDAMMAGKDAPKEQPAKPTGLSKSKAA